MQFNSETSFVRASSVLGRRPLDVTRITFRVAVIVAVAVLAGCATAHPHAEVADIRVSTVRAEQPDIPQPVRWGGTIASVDNREDGSTVLEIVSRPLTSTGRPIRNDSSDGRFFAEVNDVLDPSIIKPGRDITVTGLVGEVRDGSIGDSPYRFPVVDVDDYHYWSPASARLYARSHRCYDDWPHPFQRHRSIDCGFYGYGHFGLSHHHRGRGRGNVGLSLIIRP